MQEKLTILNNKNEKLSCVLHLPEMKSKEKFPVVLFVHGFVSGKNSKKAVELSSKLPKQGIACLRFDFSGHGESNGRFEETIASQQVKELQALIEFVKSHPRLNAKRIALIGSSLGGFDSLLYCIQNPKKVKVLILVAALSNFKEYVIRKILDRSIEEWKKTGYAFVEDKKGNKFKINYSFLEDGVKNDLVYGNAKKIKANTLIIHGTKDEIVSVNHSKKLFELLECNKELKLIEGGDHLFFEQPFFKELIDSVIHFIKKNL